VGRLSIIWGSEEQQERYITEEWARIFKGDFKGKRVV